MKISPRGRRAFASPSTSSQVRSCSSCTSRSRTAPSRPPIHRSSSRSRAARAGMHSAKIDIAARSRRHATRMSWRSSGSSPSLAPGSMDTNASYCRRSTANATSPSVASRLIAVGPRSGCASMTSPRDSTPSWNLVTLAGWSAHADRIASTKGSKRVAAASGTSISTRRSRAGGPPSGPATLVSSKAISAVSAWGSRTVNVRRLVRTSNRGTSGFVPATHRIRVPTGPCALARISGSGEASSSVSSLRFLAPARRSLVPIGSSSLSVASARRRPTRRTRRVYPARANRQSSESR